MRNPHNLPVVSVQLKEGDGRSFDCDEEPHMLDARTGYGFFPLTLGRMLNKGKYEVVRKLGWGSASSVWLARVVGYV